MSERIAIAVEQQIRQQGDLARLILADYAQRAAQILQELAVAGDSDRIRLQASMAILDRVGVTPGPVEPARDESEESQLVRDEVERTMVRIRRNALIQGTMNTPKDIEVLMLHEGEGDDLSASTKQAPEPVAVRT